MKKILLLTILGLALTGCTQQGLTFDGFDVNKIEMLFGGGTYPSSIPSYTTVSGSSSMSGHAADHNALHSDTIELSTKFGTGTSNASDATSGYVLTADGGGGSSWSTGFSQGDWDTAHIATSTTPGDWLVSGNATTTKLVFTSLQDSTDGLSTFLYEDDTLNIGYESDTGYIQGFDAVSTGYWGSNLSLSGGQGNADGLGGQVSIDGGRSGLTSGATGGDIFITGGLSRGTGTGGKTVVRGGGGGGVAGTGGNLILAGGFKGSGGVDGKVIIRAAKSTAPTVDLTVFDSGNASTTGYLVVGTGLDALVPSAGDLFVSGNASTTGNITIGGSLCVDQTLAGVECNNTQLGNGDLRVGGGDLWGESDNNFRLLSDTDLYIHLDQDNNSSGREFAILDGADNYLVQFSENDFYNFFSSNETPSTIFSISDGGASGTYASTTGYFIVGSGKDGISPSAGDLIVGGNATTTNLTITNGSDRTAAAACFLATGKLGYCSDAVGAGGTCTCNEL